MTSLVEGGKIFHFLFERREDEICIDLEVPTANISKPRGVEKGQNTSIFPTKGEARTGGSKVEHRGPGGKNQLPRRRADQKGGKGREQSACGEYQKGEKNKFSE